MICAFLNTDTFLSDTGLPVRVLIANGKVDRQSFLDAAEEDGLLNKELKFKSISHWWVIEHIEGPHSWYEEVNDWIKGAKQITIGRFHVIPQF